MCADGAAARRWRELLTARAIPPGIRAAAPDDPHRHDPARFTPPADPPDTPSRWVALDLLGTSGGTVLDVGCGAGAASVTLQPSAHHITGTDNAADMLDAFAWACEERGVPHRTVLGPWPDTAAEAGSADVVVCHHVGYNTADLGPFVLAIDAAAIRGIVLELHAEHPTSWLDPLWRRFHGLRRAPAATADDALAVLVEIGIRPRVRRWTKPARARGADEVELARRRLCLPRYRADDVARALDVLPQGPREILTISWDSSPGRTGLT
ncbi:MAG: class I SAM-dependent methyltransferase [Actinomycetota bacterium]|nr:class I SAM-dependent methyltransferase [Actinomycetota bacterium]